MADWPSIQKSDWRRFKEVPRKRQIRTPFEAGYNQSGPAATQMKRAFTLGWPSLSRTDYDTLVAFFNTNQGGSFNWEHTITGATYSVGFVDDALPEAIPIGTDYVELDGLRLEEI